MTSPSEPVAWRYGAPGGKMWTLCDEPGGLEELRADGWRVEALYAHPITPPLVTSSGEPSKDDA